MRALWLFQQRPQQATTEFEEEIDDLTLGFGGGHFGEASREAVVLLALALAFEALSLDTLGPLATLLLLLLTQLLLFAEGVGLLTAGALHAGGEEFEGRFVVHRLVILAQEGRRLNHGPTLVCGESAGAALRRDDDSALDDGWPSGGVEEGDERLAHAKLCDGCARIKSGIGAEGGGGRRDGFLVAGREGAQGVLHTIAELPEHGVGDVGRVLCAEIDANAFGADEADDLLDLFEERGRDAIEKQMGFVEKEDEARPVEVAHLGEALEKLGKKVEEEGRIELRGAHEAIGLKDVDDAAAVAWLEEVEDVNGGLAEEIVGALLLERQKAALYGPDGGHGDVAVSRGVSGALIADVLQHFAEVLEVEQQELLVVRDAEGDREDVALDVVQVEQLAEEQRSHLGDGGA